MPIRLNLGRPLHARPASGARTAICFAATALLLGCGGTTTSSSTTTSTNAYVTAYKSVDWGNTMTVTYPSSCEMTVVTTGKPNYTPPAYYLAPASTGQTVVAYTPVSNMGMAVITYASLAGSLKGSTATINICPAKATSTTATSLGAIGYLISGTAMFNPYEATQTVAVADNVSYTFTDSTGTMQTASFVDACGSHSNGSTWHAHENPNCVTSQVDTATGPSHIIGVALDGYPIYGGRDINGAIIPVSALDSCNGITSATPEFPSGAYHYVLPIGVTTKYSSINCFTGTVNATTMMAARKLGCNLQMMKTMMAGMQAVDPRQMRPAKPQTMTMPDGTTMTM